jgi:hypothetical protein
MKLFELSVACDVGVLLYFGIWLWVLVRRRDLWLRYTAREAAFWSRLHFPPSFVTANRRFSEGRAVIYFAVVGLVVGLLLLICSVGMYIYIKERRLDRPPNKSLQATRDGVQPACPVLRGSAIADYVIRPACLSSGR